MYLYIPVSCPLPHGSGEPFVTAMTGFKSAENETAAAAATQQQPVGG